ncbi:MAPEG family protein [Novosphingobium acidiphilum]|uniref:MAPEG family protein n=1 Tax=Novosphingobium acidiphilum TaxID=505248 RepID=UPI00048E3CDE|nr:MAPEG family protein [Novosphingobium acidiphilum]
MNHTVGMQILGPVIALAAWTMVMWLWMYATRIPAINRLPQPGTPGADQGWTAAMLEDMLPREIQWKAHNYNHLHEAPTVFYAVALVLAMVGAGDGLNATLAWSYVALRVIHSIWQATVNKVMPRFALFTLSTLVLIALIVRAALVLI